MGEHIHHGYVYVQHYLDAFEHRINSIEQPEQPTNDVNTSTAVQDDDKTSTEALSVGNNDLLGTTAEGTLLDTFDGAVEEPSLSATTVVGGEENDEIVNNDLLSDLQTLDPLGEGVSLASDCLNPDTTELLVPEISEGSNVLNPETFESVETAVQSSGENVDPSLSDDFNELLKFNNEAVAEVLTDVGWEGDIL